MGWSYYVRFLNFYIPGSSAQFNLSATAHARYIILILLFNITSFMNKLNTNRCCRDI